MHFNRPYTCSNYADSYYRIISLYIQTDINGHTATLDHKFSISYFISWSIMTMKLCTFGTYIMKLTVTDSTFVVVEKCRSR